MKRKKSSEYGLQLEEKQKILNHYGLRESQLRRFVREAKRTAKINWVDQLINLLERRLDNVVFRLGFAPSIPSAKQMVSYGKVAVNGQRVSIRSAVLEKGDKITLKDSAYQSQDHLRAKANPHLPLPDYLSKEITEGRETGVIRDEPKLGDFPVPFNDGLFTSYYNLKG